MEVSGVRRIRVDDQSQVAEARRAASGIAVSGGLGETEVGRVSIVATELATNLLKHGRGGELVLAFSISRLEILALDKGPGMRDVLQCLEDGYSTAGSPGNGMGAVSRLSTHVDIFSAPEKGTAVYVEFPMGAVHRPPLDGVGGLAVPMLGEHVCGDAWDARRTDSGLDVLIADGLGHGPGAAEASGTAVNIFRSHPD